MMSGDVWKGIRDLRLKFVSGPPSEKKEEYVSNDYFCDACEKDFKLYAHYEAHLATHVPCSFPGCVFYASQRIVKEHYANTHVGAGSLNDKKRMANFDSPEEIEKWREARRRNWPSATNISRKKEEEQVRKARGDCTSSSLDKRRKGPNWEIRVPRDSTSSRKTETKHSANMSMLPGAKEQKSEEGACESLTSLFSYGSDESEEAPPEQAAIVRGEEKSSSKAQERESGRVCKYFARGYCSKGKDCRFQHVKQEQKPNRKKESDKEGEYVPHSCIKRKGPSLLDRLLQKDNERDQRVVLQCIRHLIQRGLVAA